MPYLSTMIHRDALWIFKLRKEKVSKMTMKRQKTLHRFAAVAAVLLTLCLVFMMPVGAAEESDGVTVDSWNELATALAAGGTVTLNADITEDFSGVDGTPLVPSSTTPTTLNLNGHKLEAKYNTEAHHYIIKVPAGATLIIDDYTDKKDGCIFLNYTNGEIDPYAHELVVVYTDSGKIILNNGILKTSSTNGGYRGMYCVNVAGFSISEDKIPTFEMTGGRLDAEYIGVRLRLDTDKTLVSKVKITGGEISANRQAIWIHQSSKNNKMYYSLEIQDGDFKAQNSAVIGYWTQNSEKDGTFETKISGGRFESAAESTGEMSYFGIFGYNNRIGSGDTATPVSVTQHTLTISGTPTFIITGKGDYTQIIGLYKSNENGPTVSVETELSGDDKVSSKNGLKSTFSVPQIGKSYEWSVGDVALDGSSNEEEITFDPTKGSTQTVSVKIVLSDTTSTTITKDVSVPAKYEVTYNADGGEGTMNPAYAYSDNNVIDLPPCTFTAPGGKVFKAWQIGNTEYAAGVSYTVTADTSVTAVWKEVGAAVAPSLGEDVADVNDDGTTEINTSADNVEPDKINKKVTITDQSTGVTIEVQFDDNAEVTDSSAEGTVTSVTVNYQPEQTVVSEHADGEEITQTVSFTLSTVTTELPTISSAFDPNKAEKVIAENPNHKPLAMITADNAESVNNNMTQGTDKVTVTFKLPQALVESLVGTDTSLLKAYHVKDNGDVIEAGIEVDGPTNGYYYVEVTGDGFSSYVLGYEEPKTNIGNNGGGSATDTGSGNYQYYPRSVPTDGIVDFGTSKVVTGMELPAGSDGTVTLNIKPTFAMPENGFYAFEIDAPGYNTDAKINGGLSFQIPVADLEAAGWTAEDIVLFHGTVGEDGKIVWEALPTNLVKNENGVAYYKAAINGCSPFYIGFVKDGSVVNTEVVDPVTPEQPVTPDEPEVLPPVDTPETPEQPTESPAPILAVLAGLGAAAVLRRK